MEQRMYVKRRGKFVVLLLVLVLFAGCKSKQEKNATTPASPDQNTGKPVGLPPQPKPGVTPVSAKDASDTHAAALKMLALMEAGDFTAVYNGASTGFKQIGNEAAFVYKFQQARLKTGGLKNPKQISLLAQPDASIVTVYRVENKRFTTDMRLTFKRANNGTMVLEGLNQHDEPKK
jgi:hypothetical protein